MCAGDEGVEPLDLVHEAVLDKKIQRGMRRAADLRSRHHAGDPPIRRRPRPDALAGGFQEPHAAPEKRALSRHTTRLASVIAVST